MKLNIANPRRRRHRPRSRPASYQDSSPQSPNSAATTSPSHPVSSAASPSPQTGSPLPQATIDLALDSDAVFLGAVGDNKFNALSPDKRPEAGLLAIRQALGGFANLRQPRRPIQPSAPSSPLRPEVHRRRRRTSSSSVSSLAASTSARRAGGIATRTKPSTPCATPSD